MRERTERKSVRLPGTKNCWSSTVPAGRFDAESDGQMGNLPLLSVFTCGAGRAAGVATSDGAPTGGSRTATAQRVAHTSHASSGRFEIYKGRGERVWNCWALPVNDNVVVEENKTRSPFATELGQLPCCLVNMLKYAASWTASVAAGPCPLSQFPGHPAVLVVSRQFFDLDDHVAISRAN